MGIVIESSFDSERSCEQSLLRAAESGLATAWLLPDYARVVERRKALALRKSPLGFGCTVESLNSWVEDLWALYGDGRVITSAVQRKILIREALEKTGLFPVSAGRVDALCVMVKQGAGVEAFVRALDEASQLSEGDASRLSERGVPQLTETQESMLQVARVYFDLLTAANLCELAEAMRLLAVDGSVVWPAIVCEGFSTLSVSEAAFFAELSRVADIRFVASAVQGSSFDVNQSLVKCLEGMGTAIDASCDAAGTTVVSCDGVSAISRVADEDDALAVSASTLSDVGSAERCELAQLAARLYGAEGSAAIEPRGAVRSLLPSGRYAQAALLCQAIAEQEGSVLVVCNNPHGMFIELAPRLSGHGVALQAEYSRLFAETDFGQALFNAYDVFVGETLDTFQATDFVMSALSEKNSHEARSLDAGWRRDRLVDRVKIKSDIEGEGSSEDLASDDAETAFSASFVSLIQQGSYNEVFDLAEKRTMMGAAKAEAFRAEQLAAIRCARGVFEQVDRLKGDSSQVFEAARVLLESARVRVGARSEVFVGGAEVAPRVSVISYAGAALLSPASFDAVFACDLNASDQTLRERLTSVDGLFESLGFAQGHDSLFEARLRMLRIVQAAKNRLYLVRTLHDVDAAPTYPAVVFEEVVDCYRGTVQCEGSDGRMRVEPAPLDKVTSLVPALASQEYCGKRGEELFSENLSQGAPCELHRIDVASPDEVSPAFRSYLTDPIARFSASAIENYLDCPHKWFASRRLRLGRIDAGFSALEKGTFVHEVLKNFYEQHELLYGKPKPAPVRSELTAANKLLGEVFAQVREAQHLKAFRDNPLIALTEAEKRQVDGMLGYLEGFIKRDAEMLTAFTPRHHEYAFGYDGSVTYAGVPLCGSIDRIDVDDQGRAVIVDYKSSLGDSYHLCGKDDPVFVLPAKLQTLMYAQVVRRELGLKPVAAVYVHTQRPGSNPVICGAYDDAVLGPLDLPGIKAERSAVSQAHFDCFEELLDAVEDAIAQRLEDVQRGDISVSPRFEKSCDFCPVLACAGRK
ncbi:MAG: PD-(D/E)XK nuclease family protein [Eggerthellaceae bacterium]|nr:PD-(D/E)XK nuclease family protein [Eggerthellaceae bacterium]